MAKDIRVTPQLVEARRLALAHNVLPITHSFVSDLETPVSAFLKLGAPRRAFLLESAEQGQHLGRYSFLGVGARALVTYSGGRLCVQENGNRLEVEHADPFAAAAELIKSYSPPRGGGSLPPLAGGLVGYFGYDLVRRLEDLPDAPPDDLGLPEMAFLLADTVLVFDHLKHVITVVANAFVEGRDVDGPYERAVERIVAVKEALKAPLPGHASAAKADSGAGRQPAGRQLEHDSRAVRGRRRPHPRVHLRRRRLPGRAHPAFQPPVDVAPFAVYRGLRAVNPTPYMFYIAFDDFALCGSPEPLVTVQGDQVEVRPIAGTRRRGADAAEDRAPSPSCSPIRRSAPSTSCWSTWGATTSAASAAPGTVEVDELMEVERYSHVMHLVSNVRGTLAPGTTPIDALRAAFPAGTRRGAPKIRAMEIIDELEPCAAGPTPAPSATSATPATSTPASHPHLVVKDGDAYVQAGAGIVADSDPATRVRETREQGARRAARRRAGAHEEFASMSAQTQCAS